MAQESELKVYELAYHLIPELEEADVKVKAQEISDIITQNGGSVLVSKEPKRTHLSYPVKHKQYANFGVFEFSAPAETVEKLNSQLKLNNDVLRFLLIKRPSKKVLRTLGEQRTERRMKTQETKPKVPVTEEQPTKKTEEIKPEELEKEIEEVIKGL